MEEINPVLKGRCVTEKSDFKDQIWVEAVQWHHREVPESQRTGLVWTSEVQDCEKNLRPALPHCIHKASKNRGRCFPTLGRASAVRTGHRLFKEVPESAVRQERLRMSLLCLGIAPCSLTGKRLAAWTHESFQSTPKRTQLKQWCFICLTCYHLFPSPAVTCMQW